MGRIWEELGEGKKNMIKTYWMKNNLEEKKVSKEYDKDRRCWTRRS